MLHTSVCTRTWCCWDWLTITSNRYANSWTLFNCIRWLKCISRTIFIGNSRRTIAWNIDCLDTVSILRVLGKDSILDICFFLLCQVVLITNQCLSWFCNRQTVFQLPLSDTNITMSCCDISIIYLVGSNRIALPRVTRTILQIILKMGFYNDMSWLALSSIDIATI